MSPMPTSDGGISRSSPTSLLTGESAHSSDRTQVPPTLNDIGMMKRSCGIRLRPMREHRSMARAYERPIWLAPYSGRVSTPSAVRARPPTRCDPSRTITSRPKSFSSRALFSPLSPPPMTTTLVFSAAKPFVGRNSG